MLRKPLATLVPACALGLTLATPARGADIVRRFVAELDPVAPSSAAYQSATSNVGTSEYGASADFNVGGVMSTGPELWTGTFDLKGPSNGQTYQRYDLYPGESQRLDAIRLRWMFTAWEEPESMRGWYLKGGYSYTRINSRANRYLATPGAGDALPANVPGSTPATNTALVQDTRHGVVFGVGNRWLFADQKLTVTVGASITATFKRSLTDDGQDPNALADYDDVINRQLPDTKISTRPMPEANLGLGYAW